MKSGPERSFGELTSMHVQQAVGGDAESVGWIVARFSPLLIAQANYRLGTRLRSVVDAEDLVNETWMTALPRLETLDARDGSHTGVVLKFLSRTLLFRIQNLARKQLRRGRVQANLPADAGEDAGDPMRELPAEMSGAVTRAIRAERRDAIYRALDELTEAEREIIVLRGVEQQSNNVVSVLLGISGQAATMRYRRALDKLREKLPSSVFDEFDDGAGEAGDATA